METVGQGCSCDRVRSGKAQALACCSWPDTLVTRVVCCHYQMWMRREGAWPMIGYTAIRPWARQSLLLSPRMSSVVCAASLPTLSVEKPLLRVSADASGLGLLSSSAHSVIPGL